MVEAVMLWNEPNNLSHWDFHIDPEWMMFAEMTIAAAGAIRKINPNLKIVLGGMSPVDAISSVCWRGMGYWTGRRGRHSRFPVGLEPLEHP